MFCVARYECEESFTTLNVDIRNHQNLLDSMEQYVKGDLLEGANAYHCEKCNKKVRTELHVVVVVVVVIKPFLLVCMVTSIKAAPSVLHPSAWSSSWIKNKNPT